MLKVLPGGQLVQPLLDFIYGSIRRGGARRNPHRLRPLKPFRAQVVCRLHMMHLPAVTAANPHQFLCIVAVRAADDHHHIRLLRQLDGSVLALLGGPANRVNKPHLRAGKSPPYQPHEPAHVFNGLGGLRRHAKARPLSQL